MKLTLRRALSLAIFFSLIVFACQEDDLNDATDQLDEDMNIAIDMAEGYLGSDKARAEGAEKSITVLKFKDGKLYFDTNTDSYKGYQEIEETSITANAEPGEYIFWYSGGGVTELDEIDFDETAEDFLENLPEEINPEKMWVVRIPVDFDGTEEFLKYDIVYETKDSPFPIRLDPKIRVTQVDGEPGEGEGEGGGE